MGYLRYLTKFGSYLLLPFVFVIPQQIFAAECQSVGQLVSLEGAGEKRSHGHEAWLMAQLNERVCVGDALRTHHGSRAAVRLADDTLVRLDGDSLLVITQVFKKGDSLLDLLFGAIHFISRTQKSLTIRTPYINAFIEGTEAVVRIKDDAADVTILEGTVVASNKAGSVELMAGQTAHAGTNQPPVRMAQVKPHDAVAWALYYPPLPSTPSDADKLARECIVAIVQNRLEEATELADRALAADDSSAAAYMARSYLNQALFDIPAALGDIKRAAELAPQSPLVQARLAEVQMMSGDLRAARQVAVRTVNLNPEHYLAHTVLGFASLRQVSLNASKASFTEAITYDSTAPLPRLGLGLVKIRQGQLESGREEIETAVLLDPNKALLRSYLGKAYYEETRDRLAFEQLAMAKELDPNDPTAWYYDSILLQSVNRPVEALQAQQKAISLNDNRGVYRSRQLLDKDEAARSVSLGRIYNDLNFEQQAHYQATDALARDPANHSAHRLLADSYSGIANRDAARQSELLQSKMTQPLNLDPLQPQLSNANLGLLDGNGPGDLSYSEYNPLFTRNGLALQLDTLLAENSTWGDDIVVAGLFDRLAFSVGQYHKETDLVVAENGYQQDIVNGFAQYQLGEESSIQLEASRNEEVKGDVSQRLLPDYLNHNYQVDSVVSTVRLGFNGSLTTHTRLLMSAARRDIDSSRSERSYLPIQYHWDENGKIDLYDIQVVGKQDAFSWLVGLSHQAGDSDTIRTYVHPSRDDELYLMRKDLSQTRLYGYMFYQAGPSLSLTGGLTSLGEKKERSDGSDELRKTCPKVGLRFVPITGQEILLAAFRTRASIVPTSLYETLEPTHIVGFNQLFDDFDETDSSNYAAAYNFRLSRNLHAGVSTVIRELETPITLTDYDVSPSVTSIQNLEYDDKYAGFWLNWTSSPRWALGIDYTYNRYDLKKGVHASDFSIFVPDGILNLTTHELSASLNYFHPRGFIGEVAATYYDQEGEFIDRRGDINKAQYGKDSGVVTDLSLSYRFPKRKGSVSIGIKNVFDNNMNYEDRSSYDANVPENTSSPSSFAGERVWYGEVSVVFR